MRYSLSDLLEQARREAAVALYLTPGHPPVFALRCKQYDPSLASVMLFPAEGADLTSEDIRDVLDTLRRAGYTGPAGHASVAEFRYRVGEFDFDVFVFISTDTARIEFRIPYVTK